MSTPESDGDSIYNHILNGIDTTVQTTQRAVISVQPTRTDDLGSRFLFPIFSGLRNHTILPLYGIQILNEVEEMQVQQTIHLNDLFSAIETVNKFLVRADNGDVIYEAREGSSGWQRVFCGSSRRFILRLFDRTHQEALFFIRRLAPTNPIVSCYLQRMDVFIPQCDYIGCIQQKWTPSAVTLNIRNYLNENMYEVEGPLCSCCTTNREMDFDVIGLDTSHPVSRISHKWDETRAVYVLNILFLCRLDSKKKALILACAFLLDYIYFHSEQSAGCFFCLK